MNKKDTIERINKDIDEYIHDSSTTSYHILDNKGIISLDLSNYDSIYNIYSSKSELSSDIYEYIDNTFNVVKKNLNITFNIIYPNDMDNQEKEKIRNLIKIHYAVKFKNERLEIKKSNILGLILLLIGAILLAAYFIAQRVLNSNILAEIIDIFGWVFIWESCYAFIFSTSSHRLERIKAFRIFDAINN